MSDLTDRRPLYRRLRDEIASEIARGVWKPGEKIATEAELITKYTVAAGTIGKALDLLEEDGLVERIQGSGTYVRRPNFQTALIQTIRYFGCAADGRTPRGRILKREVLAPPPEIASALHLRSDASALRLQRLRIHDGLPVLREVIWLDAERFAAIIQLEDIQPQLLYPLYEKLCGEIVARIHETVTIETADQSDADLLGLGLDRPVVVIKRLALGYDNHPIEWRCSRGPASDLQLKLEIR